MVKECETVIEYVEYSMKKQALIYPKKRSPDQPPGQPPNGSSLLHYNTIINHYNQEISPQGCPPQPLLLLNVNRVARTRKTFTLLKACTRIQEMAIVARKGNPVF